MCYGDAASLMGEVTFTQQQQHLSRSLSFVHASSYPEGHDKRVSRSISKPPTSVREEVNLLGCNMEYNPDFSANKGVGTDDKGKGRAIADPSSLGNGRIVIPWGLHSQIFGSKI